MSYLNHYRKSSRDPLKRYLPTDIECKTIDSEFMASVQNLGATSAFIITQKPLTMGQEIAMTIKFPNNGDTIKATGDIVRITAEGVGVKFTIFFNK